MLKKSLGNKIYVQCIKGEHMVCLKTLKRIRAKKKMQNVLFNYDMTDSL